MKTGYIAPVADCLFFIPKEHLATSAPMNLLEGAKGPGEAAKNSKTDIKIFLDI
jgi:hypothetical protein